MDEIITAASDDITDMIGKILDKHFASLPDIPEEKGKLIPKIMEEVVLKIYMHTSLPDDFRINVSSLCYSLSMRVMRMRVIAEEEEQDDD